VTAEAVRSRMTPCRRGTTGRRLPRRRRPSLPTPPRAATCESSSA